MPHGVRNEPDCLKNGHNEFYVTGNVLFEEWPKWKCCFKQYHLASRLSVASEEQHSFVLSQQRCARHCNNYVKGDRGIQRLLKVS